MKKYVIWLVFVLMLISCATVPRVKDRFDAFETDPTIKMCPYPPSADQVNSDKSVIEITSFDDSKLDKENKAGLSNIMTNSVEQCLIGAVKVINTSNEQKKEFLKLLKKCELDGNCKLIENKPLEYALMGSVDSIDILPEFVEAHEAINIIGKKVKVNSQCKYTATVVGSIKIFSFPNVELVNSLVIKGGVSKEVDTKDSNCSSSLTTMRSLIREAADKAIEDVSADIKNQMPPKGYIVERRVNKDAKKEYIFRLSIGAKRGLKAGDEVTIYTLEKLSDDFTKKDIIAKREIAVGKVTDLIEEPYSWIKIDDVDKADKIRNGDFVKITYQKGLFQIIRDWIKIIGL